MAKFKKALALVLSLAMVLTLAPIANVSAAKAKYKISAKTTAIAAEKTYNVKVTGVAKTQYVKIARTAGVTVKYNGKTIKASKKVAGTGKALTFKVTVPDKVANYKSTIKAQIFNKKTNKKVKTLSTKRTVKVKEFAITKVEPATSQAGNTVKYLVVEFSKALDSLAASEVEIRNAKTQQLFTVEKVDLAANGKSAVVTLLGNDQAGTTGYLSRLVDYTLSITKNSATASLPFNIPMVAERVVTSIDPVKKTFTIGAVVGTTVTLGDKILVGDKTVDYFDLLGKDVIVSYDGDFNLVSVADAGYKAVYGSFKAPKEANADTSLTITDVADSTKQYTTYVGTPSNNNAVTQAAAYGKNAAVLGNGTAIAADPTGATVYTYAKVILNSNSTIRRIVTLPALTKKYVATIKDTYVTDYTGAAGEVNLKDYTVIKDHKLATFADIQKDNTIFYNTTNAIAILETNSKKGAITSVNSDRVTIDGTIYKYADIGNTALIIDEANTFTAITTSPAANPTDGEKAFTTAKAGGDVTLYFGLNGEVAFIKATAGAEATTTNTYVLKDAFATYSLKNTAYLTATLTNGKDTLELDIPVSQLKSVKGRVAANNVSGTPVAVTGTLASVPTAGNKVAAFESLGNNLGTGTAVYGKDYAFVKSSETAANAEAAGTVIDLHALAAGSLVKVTTNKDNKVTGLDVSYSADVLAGTEDFSKNPSVGNTAKVTTTATPVFEVVFNTAGTPASGVKSVTATTLGEYTSKMNASTANSYVVINGDDASKADYVVVDKASTVATASVITSTKTAVVVDLTTKNDDGTRVADVLTVVFAGENETKTFDKFDANTNATLLGLAKGDVIRLSTDKDNKVIFASTDPADSTKLNTGATGGTITAGTGSTATSSSVTINGTGGPVTLNVVANTDYSSLFYSKEADGSIKKIEWSDVTRDVAKIASAKWSLYKGVAGQIEVLVVEIDEAAVNTNVAAGINADIAADVALITGSAATAATTYTLPTAANGSTITYTVTTAGTKVTAAATGTYGAGNVIAGALTLTAGTGTDVVITATVAKAGGTTVTKTITIKDNADPTKADITVA